MKLHFIIIPLLVLLIIILIILFYNGLFKTITIKESNNPSYTLVYKKNIGPYHKTGVVMDEIYDSLLKDKIETYKGFGIYYDSPQNTAKDQLRSIGGCIVETKDLEKLKQLKNKYKIAQFPASTVLTTDFPYKNKLSVVLGIFKVYPVINKYMQKNNYQSVPIMEIYDIPEKKINYILAVNLDTAIFDQYLH